MLMGTSPLSYQWYLNSTAMCTFPVGTTPATTTIGDSSSYTVKVANSAAWPRSSAADSDGSATGSDSCVCFHPRRDVWQPAFHGLGKLDIERRHYLFVGEWPRNRASNSGTVAITGTGTVFIAASEASGNYTAATATTSFVVYGEAQTINLANPGTQTYASPLTLSANLHQRPPSRTIPVRALQACARFPARLSLSLRRECTIDANQAGNSDYAPATMVPQQLHRQRRGANHHLCQSRSSKLSLPRLRFLQPPPVVLPLKRSPATTSSVCTVSGTAVTFLDFRNLHHRRESGW